jgi:glycerol-3-phosphate dehydrogenase
MRTGWQRNREAAEHVGQKTEDAASAVEEWRMVVAGRRESCDIGDGQPEHDLEITCTHIVMRCVTHEQNAKKCGKPAAVGHIPAFVCGLKDGCV